MRINWRSLMAMVVAGVVLSANEVLACPQCRAALDDAENAQPQAYMVSILFMLGLAGSTCLGVILFLWKMNQYEQSQLQQAGYQHLFHNAVTAGQGTASPTA